MSGSVAADARIRAAAAAERRAGASRRPELEEPPPKRPKAKTNSQILEELGITDHQRDMECTLSHQVFDDPVIADDNHTYERAYIEGYFASCKGRVISPLTNEPLANTQLRPNLQLRKVVEAYVEVEVRKARARLGVSVAPLPTNDDDDDGVAIVGAVTRAERNLAGRSAAVDLTMDDDEMMLPDGTRIDELGLDEAALRPPEAPHAPPAAPLPAPAALAAVPSVAMPAAASLPPVPGQLTAASTAAAAAASSAAAAAAPSALPTSPAHDGAPAVHTSPAHDGALPTKRKVTIHVQRTHAPGGSSFLYSENGRLGKLKERYCEQEERAGRPLPLSAVTFRFAGVRVEDAHTPLALGMALSPQINMLEVDEPSGACIEDEPLGACIEDESLGACIEVDEPSAAVMEGKELPNMEGQELPNMEGQELKKAKAAEGRACVASSVAATAASAAATSAAAASSSATATTAIATAAAAAAAAFPQAHGLFTVADVKALVACMDHPIRKARQLTSSLREVTLSQDLL